MRMIQAGIVVAVFAALSPGIPQAKDQTPAVQPEISYAEFIKLDYAARRQRFAEVNAETKASIMRSHISDWLNKNRERLSAGQVEVVEDVIAFVAPALYQNPTAPDFKARFDALEARLACKLRHSDIMTAFKPSIPPKAATWLEDFTFWFNACLLGGLSAG